MGMNELFLLELNKNFFNRTSRIIDLAMMNNRTNVPTSPQLQNKIAQKRRSSLYENIPSKQKFNEKIDENIEKNTREYLEVSDIKYDPNASPSSSCIRKQQNSKVNQTNSDQFLKSFLHTSISFQQKRVGFHDPVYFIKEYFITKEEEKLKKNTSRCLKYDQNEDQKQGNEDNGNKENEITIKEETIEITEANHQESEFAEITDHDYGTKSDAEFSFKSKKELFDYFTNNIDELVVRDSERSAQDVGEDLTKTKLISKFVQAVGFDTLLNEFSATISNDVPPTEQIRSILPIVGEISKIMKKNLKIKHQTIDILTKNHSEDFLDCVLQDNSTKTICDRIGMDQISSYLIHRANISEAEFDPLLTEMNHAMIQKFIKMIKNTKGVCLKRQEIFDILQILFLNKPKMEGENVDLKNLI